MARAIALPSGGWFVLDGSRRLAHIARHRAHSPRRYEVDGRELVVWWGKGQLRIAPAACPHMGADLSAGRVRGGCVVCPWHGLEVDTSLPVHDDGVLTWVRMGDGAEGSPIGDARVDRLLPAPILPARPPRFVDAVIRVEATCEPEDVIANRLDPWHGVHLHPYAFARLRVLEAAEDRLDLVVAYRVVGPWTVEVTARFACPEPRTIVMTILEGEGAGSVVETHATPLLRRDAARPWIMPRTAIIEATLATSERTGFEHALRAGGLLRPLIARMAGRLWRDDAAYAERRYRVRAHT